MSDPVNAEHKFRYGTSTRSNINSTHFSEPAKAQKTPQTFNTTNGFQPSLIKADLGANSLQVEATLHRQTRDWVYSCHGYSIGGDHQQQKRDLIHQQLRAAAALERELARLEAADGEAKSDTAVKNETNCQSVQGVGAWADEKDKQY
ncbi:hypothetical protein AYL99_07826 [Fonsecaea erecta]|uniref:Uncharacterized protein n=1 Tax=Fonsecaea erecta TaxID=1367422 RepID=A0A178ZH07_9EURO|nr:hypothetical protein AYL99_07826 [Fonsecaea erecta]OAP58736.1 hypothetical protein AYL99_07826 [Fonsecaea erecta]